MYQTWDELEAACMGCQKCGLCSGRTNLVFGVGNKKAKILFIGEGPGEQGGPKGGTVRRTQWTASGQDA